MDSRPQTHKEICMDRREVWINLAKYWLIEEIRDKESGGITFIELLEEKTITSTVSEEDRLVYYFLK